METRKKKKKSAPLDSAIAAVGRAARLVAPNRGAGRAARPRASRRAVGVFARRRVGILKRGSSRREDPRLAAPIGGRRLVIARLFESASDATRFRARGSRRGDAPSVRTKHARDG